jgi:arylsulfatase A-like enzyme
MVDTILVDLTTAATTGTILVDLKTAATTETVLVDLKTAATTETALVELETAATTETVLVDLKTAATTETIVVEVEQSDPPNFLVINLDDVGIDFFGGVTQYRTWLNTIADISSSDPPGWPTMTNIQLIADAGVVFLNSYCTPNCSPGRACFQTGRYAMRQGVGEIINDERGSGPSAVYPWEHGFQEFAVDPKTGALTEYILPKLLSDAGYTTAHVGKWHMAVPNGTPKSVDPFVASRWWEDDPRTGLDRARIPWEGDLALGDNVPYQEQYTGYGWLHPINIGWGEFRGTHSNLERMPNDDLKNAWTEGQLSNGFAAPADSSGVLKPGYYNYLWYDSRAEAVTQETTYITTYGRSEVYDVISKAKEPWFVTWEHHAVHSPFGGQPDNGGGYSGCLAPDANINSSAGTYSGTATTDDIVWNSARSSLEAVDWNIGQLKTSMGADLWARTVVIIRCDNGTSSTVLKAGVEVDDGDFGDYEANVIDKTRLKRTIYEAGIRVPLIISGPGVGGTLGRVNYERVQATDLFSTILDLARTTKTNAEATDRYFDTYTFEPVLAADAGVTARDFMFFERFDPNGSRDNASFVETAVTKEFLTHPTTSVTLATSKAGTWKYLDFVNEDGTTSTHLFRLLDKDDGSADPYEQTDLIDSADSDIVAIKTALIAKMAAVLASEPSYPGDPSGADT